METYLVGGAVRDALMGLPVQDRDWVVVGATAQELLNLGYVQVGRDFPVFLHPHSKEEYALARTERNTAPGYRGFAVLTTPEVTLEEDLARRDLTINSIAVHADFTGAGGLFSSQDGSVATAWETGDALIDPYGGRQDIANKVLRHVTPAFREDPVRILRLARFAARFSDFQVAPETQTLMQEMVNNGDVDHLVAERVWQEMARGLMEAQPSRMFAVLRGCGALARLLPELDHLWAPANRAVAAPDTNAGEQVMRVLDTAAHMGADLPVRFACLTQHLGDYACPTDTLAAEKQGAEGGQSDAIAASLVVLRVLCQRLRVPVECKELSDVVARECRNIHLSANLDANATVRLLERCDALRKPARFAQVLLACGCDARGRSGHHDAPYPQAVRLTQALQNALSVATDLIAGQAQLAGATGPKIGEWIHRARVQAVAVGH